MKSPLSKLNMNCADAYRNRLVRLLPVLDIRNARPSRTPVLPMPKRFLVLAWRVDGEGVHYPLEDSRTGRAYSG